MEAIYHIPAMLKETIEGLAIKPGGVYVDVTFGGGGHSRAILERLDANVQRDNVQCTKDEGVFVNNSKWTFVHSNFRYLRNWMDYYGVKEIDGLLADLGVSFHHFDCPERGFSFRYSAPLDMRMNQTARRTAADIVNSYSEEELAKLFWLYGEMKNGRAVARAIVKARAQKPILRTEELINAALNLHITPPGMEDSRELDIPAQYKKDLARLFQALRIEVNDEMGALREMLVAARDLLKPGGRIAILTYHSLEDRLVKNFLRSGNLEGTIEKDFYGNALTPFDVIEKGRTASDDEVERNPRSRSAKLRVAEKK